jgi:hypothetical protein
MIQTIYLFLRWSYGRVCSSYGDPNIDFGVMETVQKAIDHEHGKTIVSDSACCSNQYSEYSIEDDYSPEVTLFDVTSGLSYLFSPILIYLLLS